MKYVNKLGQKLNAMSNVTAHIDLPKQRMLLDLVFFSQFSFCPLSLAYKKYSRSDWLVRTDYF